MTASTASSRRLGLAVCALAYVGAFFAGAYVVQILWHLDPRVAVVSANLAAVIVVFTFSVAYDNSSLVDPYWSVTPPLLALYWLGQAVPGVPAARQMLVFALVLLWSIRLTLEWARAWDGLRHEHWRWGVVRARSGGAYWLVSFFGIHLLPAAILLLASAPLAVALATGTRPLGPLDALAAAVAGGAIVVDLAAARRRQARGLTSSAPYHRGEIAFWWGVYLFSLAARPEASWLIAGPLAVTLLLAYGSLPLLDRPGLARSAG